VLQREADTLTRKTSPFFDPPAPEIDRGYLWLDPRLVAEISFLKWTPSGETRHPVFHGRRDDKPAESVTEEPVVDVEYGGPIRDADRSDTCETRHAWGRHARGPENLQRRTRYRRSHRHQEDRPRALLR
jgi:ATP dependent DNA ligase C terminal region